MTSLMVIQQKLPGNPHLLISEYALETSDKITNWETLNWKGNFTKLHNYLMCSFTTICLMNLHWTILAITISWPVAYPWMSVHTYALITTESSIQHGNFRNNWTRYIHALAKQNAKCNKKFHIAKFRPNYQTLHINWIQVAKITNSIFSNENFFYYSPQYFGGDYDWLIVCMVSRTFFDYNKDVALQSPSTWLK